ncbi:cupin domain-containing protein [Tabrizicola sp. J26]|uniref:cupin domain-containing protein n=1 Tax=Alitabrizicola rongguiensis TaxID=2909234 RepID=UPI001F18FC68|nr:cupin domain-containing protein [Tabrizicola rongguiensis]MCF1707681.1 cupin domain-containing protein [Tabrizicola rongguiensis]
MGKHSKQTVWLAAGLAGLAGLSGGVALGRASYPPLDVLLTTSETVIGQPFAYPTGTPKVTAAIVTMVPGQETGWHRHNVPLFAWMLEGELTVDYGPKGTKVYRKGDSLIEAYQSPHNGRNTGNDDVRLIAVFMGADGIENTTGEAN